MKPGNYVISIDSVPTVAQIEAEFDVVLAQVAAFTPTPELTRAIFEEMVNRIARRISFKISAKSGIMDMDGECRTLHTEAKLSGLSADRAEIMDQRRREN